MEYNKDESRRCLELAKKHLLNGDKDKALRFALKSQKLYTSADAQSLIEKMTGQGRTPPSAKPTQSYDILGNGDVSHDYRESVNYTKEQVDAVNRIKRCRNYYEILGVSQHADRKEVKRNYRKLALQFHPDKNQAPCAAEAFKAIGNAFSVLSDPVKRQKYDLAGKDGDLAGRDQTCCKEGRSQWSYSRGFESDHSADEIFNTFFGAAFTRIRTTHTTTDPTAHTFRRHHHVNSESAPQLLLQLTPIIILVAVSLASLIFVTEQPYSIHQSSKYSQRRETKNFKLLYYVSPDFSQKYTKSFIDSVEREIEHSRYNSLVEDCAKEKSKRNTLKWKAKSRNDGNALLATNMELRSCNMLEKINQT